MLFGLLLLLLGCLVVCCAEDLFFISGLALSSAEGALLKMPCALDEVDLKKVDHSKVVYLQNCEATGGRFVPSGPEMEKLGSLRDCLPEEGVHGAWLQVNLRQYRQADNVWVPMRKFGDLAPVTLAGPEARIGSLEVSAGLAEQIPGEIVPLRRCPSQWVGLTVVPGGGAADGPARSEHDANILYCQFSQDPFSPSDGDVRAFMTVGHARAVSALGAVFHGKLQTWRPDGELTEGVMVSLFHMGLVKRGTVSAETMLEEAGPHPLLHVWAFRGIAFALMWVGMSLMLFPNHVGIGSDCTGNCWLRSFPGALATSLAMVCSSNSFLLQPRATACAVLVLVPALLALGSGFDVRGCIYAVLLRMLNLAGRVLGRPPLRPEDAPVLHGEGCQEEGDGYEGLAGDDPRGQRTQAARLERQRSALDTVASKALRLAALSIGLGLVIAGPVIRCIAVINFFGVFVYAVQSTN